MKRLMIFLSIAVVTLVVPLVHAETTTPFSTTKLQAISASCQSAQTKLQGFQKAEIVTRSNRSNKYEDILRLMASFNARASLNKINISPQTQIVSDMTTRLNDFRATYRDYDTMLSELTSMSNCTDSPQEFYVLLEDVRIARTKVSEDVKAMDALLEQFSQSVDGVRSQVGGVQ